MIPAAAETPRLSKIAEFAEAENHGRRADILLRMPLIVIHDYRFVLEQTCKATGFTPGEDYIRETVEALYARRDASGSFKGDVADRVATAGAPLQELADAWRPVSEADGACRRACYDAEAGHAAASDGTELTGGGQCECPHTRAARENCPAWRWKR